MFDLEWKYGFIVKPNSVKEIREDMLTMCAYSGPINTPYGTSFQLPKAVSIGSLLPIQPSETSRECFSAPIGNPCAMDQTPENCAECRE